MYVCQTINFESLDVESSYLHIWYTSTEYKSSSYMKVIGSSSRSHEYSRVVGLREKATLLSGIGSHSLLTVGGERGDRFLLTITAVFLIVTRGIGRNLLNKYISLQMLTINRVVTNPPLVLDNTNFIV